MTYFMATTQGGKMIDYGKRHKGVTYFATRPAAIEQRDRLIADGRKGARVVEYIRGFAVQLYISGPYF